MKARNFLLATLLLTACAEDDPLPGCYVQWYTWPDMIPVACDEEIEGRVGEFYGRAKNGARVSFWWVDEIEIPDYEDVDYYEGEPKNAPCDPFDTWEEVSTHVSNLYMTQQTQPGEFMFELDGYKFWRCSTGYNILRMRTPNVLDDFYIYRE